MKTMQAAVFKGNGILELVKIPVPVLTASTSVLDVLKDNWGEKPDIIIDAVGTGDIFADAVHLINSGGRILLFGFNKTAMSNVPPSIFCVKELSVMGTRSKAFPEAGYNK